MCVCVRGVLAAAKEGGLSRIKHGRHTASAHHRPLFSLPVRVLRERLDGFALLAKVPKLDEAIVASRHEVEGLVEI